MTVMIEIFEIFEILSFLAAKKYLFLGLGCRPVLAAAVGLAVR